MNWMKRRHSIQYVTQTAHWVYSILINVYVFFLDFLESKYWESRPLKLSIIGTSRPMPRKNRLINVSVFFHDFHCVLTLELGGLGLWKRRGSLVWCVHKHFIKRCRAHFSLNSCLLNPYTEAQRVYSKINRSSMQRWLDLTWNYFLRKTQSPSWRFWLICHDETLSYRQNPSDAVGCQDT